MKLGDKLRSLRAVEGSLRGLGRSMTQQELATAMKSEIANREWRPAPSNAHHAPAAGAILPRLSRFSGGRS